MIINNIINRVCEIVCEVVHKSSFLIYNDIKKLLNNINSDKLLDELNNYSFINTVIIQNSNDTYTKYIIYSCDDFDIVLIKWQKDSFTRVHDHPDKGCIIKVLSGELIEECYDNYLSLMNFNVLTKNMIGYKIGKKVLHKLICKKEAVTLHIYIGGKYQPNYY